MGKTCLIRRLAAALQAAKIARTTGRRYPIKLDTLDDESLRELQRLLRDLDHEKRIVGQQARLQPRRRWPPRHAGDGRHFRPRYRPNWFRVAAPVGATSAAATCRDSSAAAGWARSARRAARR